MNGWFYNPENDSAKLQIPISLLCGNNAKKKKNNNNNKQIKSKQATKQTTKTFLAEKKTRIKQTKTQTDFSARDSLNGNKIIKRLCYIEESRYFNTDPARMRERTCRSKNLFHS